MIACARRELIARFGGGGNAVAQRWSDEFAVHVREWCKKVAALGVDALADAGLIDKGEFKRASDFVAEELFVRLCLHDYPPVPESQGTASDAEPAAPE